MDRIDAVDAHYRKYVDGEPEYIRFVKDRGLIGLLEWPKGSSNFGVHFYATLGFVP